MREQLRESGTEESTVVSIELRDAP